MTASELIDHFGSLTTAARALEVSAPSIIGWRESGVIPIDRQCQIELVTNGALKADRNSDGMPVKRDARSTVQGEAA